MAAQQSRQREHGGGQRGRQQQRQCQQRLLRGEPPAVPGERHGRGQPARRREQGEGHQRRRPPGRAAGRATAFPDGCAEDQQVASRKAPRNGDQNDQDPVERDQRCRAHTVSVAW
ncbi:hypothetical protein [Nonomuraea dietziae]|uniref:hypothetical protein n=1 Tax=Nonomuraea dietziae TaxID=65515 RepID=UPI0031E3E2A1